MWTPDMRTEMNFLSAAQKFLFLPILGSAVFLQALFLFSTDGPQGLDGYYYALQVRSIMSHFRLETAASSPLAFYILALPSFLIGDPVIGIKIGILCISVLISIMVYLMIRRATGFYLLANLALALVSFPFLLKWGLTEFLKSTVGLLVFVSFLYYLTASGFEKPKKKWMHISAWLAFFLTAAATHKTTSIYIGFFAAAFIFFAIKRNGGKVPALVFYTAGIAASISSFAFFFRHELLRMKNEIEFGIFWPIDRTYASAGWMLMLLCLSGILLVVISAQFRQNLNQNAACLCIFLTVIGYSLIFILNPFIRDLNFDGPLTRFRFQSYLMLAMSLPLFLYGIRGLRGRDRFLTIPALIGILFFPGLFVSDPSLYGSNPAFHRKQEDMVADIQLPVFQSQDMLLVEHGIEFAVRFRTDRLAFSRIQSVQGKEFWWVFYIGPAPDEFRMEICREFINLDCRAERSLVLVSGAKFNSWWNHLQTYQQNVITTLNPAMNVEMERSFVF